jgi:NO-binding membrane sensor protein with MHYT domain
MIGRFLRVPVVPVATLVWALATGGKVAVLTIHNFTYGLLTPALGYVMSCLGAFLGLRCATRARAHQGAARARWLLLAGVSIGTEGIWVMHFIAMLGFTIPGETIRYNVPITILSMLIAVVIVCVGLLIVGFGGQGYRPLLVAGVITGLGVASMHYVGMAAMRMPGKVTYNPGLFVLSVLIAVVAAIAALWAALRLRGVMATLGAALIMGVGVSGMHYTGMAAMRMYRASGPTGMVMGGAGGANAENFLLPLILGISILCFILTATIALSPSEEEIRSDAALLERIEAFREDPAAAELPAARPTTAWSFSDSSRPPRGPES